MFITKNVVYNIQVQCKLEKWRQWREVLMRCPGAGFCDGPQSYKAHRALTSSAYDI